MCVCPVIKWPYFLRRMRNFATRAAAAAAEEEEEEEERTVLFGTCDSPRR